ncbi:hypothetical protein [Pantoea agglomerans]|uniref:hypothetical protein n=1 Tax=Enterobacter agglomerans TaxID=549 RepID=UPI000E00DE59|nr:hypothetical protein [Pantoea agglomerans]SUC48986.1 Uncharacterised protein [Pantoea agglomerans]
MKKQIYKDLEKIAFESKFKNISDLKEVKYMIDTKSKNINFQYLIETAINAYAFKTEKIYTEYQLYQSTINTINTLIDEKKEYEALLEKEKIKEFKSNPAIEFYENKLRFHNRDYNRKRKFIENMQSLYAKNSVHNFYHEISVQLKAYDDLIYYLIEHKNNDMQYNDYIILHDSLKNRRINKMNIAEFNEVYNKYISILETKLINEGEPEIISPSLKIPGQRI